MLINKKKIRNDNSFHHVSDYLGGPLCASKEVVVLRDGEVTFGSGSGQVKVEVETTLDMWSFGVGIATGMCLLVFLVLVVWGIIKYKKQQRLKAIGKFCEHFEILLCFRYFIITEFLFT